MIKIEKEDRDDILLKSLKDAVNLLKKEFGKDVNSWGWGKIHTLEMKHIAFGDIKPLSWIFNVGEFPMPGGRHTVNMAYYPLNNREKLLADIGAAYRQIIDLNDLSNTLMIIPTGESGYRFSRHYKDQAEKWYRGEYNEVKMDLDDIMKEIEGELILKPAQY